MRWRGGCGGGNPHPPPRDSTFCTKAWSKPFQPPPPAPRKAPYFTEPSVQSVGCPNPDPHTHPGWSPPPSLEPLRSYLHWKEQIRGG